MTVAQKLDRKISITTKDAETGRDEWNLPIYGELTFTVSASRQDASDGERMAAGSVGGFLMTRFVVRHSQRTAGILPSDKLTHEGRDYNIIGTKETEDGRRRFIEITTNVNTDTPAHG